MKKNDHDLYEKLKTYHEQNLSSPDEPAIPTTFETMLKQLKVLRRDQSKVSADVEMLTDQVKAHLQKDEYFIEELRQAKLALENEKKRLINGLLDLIDLLASFVPVIEQIRDEQTRANLDELYRAIYKRIFPKMGVQIERPEKGEPFDALYHHTHSTSRNDDLPNGAILDVISDGCTFGAEVIRKAVVIVNKTGEN